MDWEKKICIVPYATAKQKQLNRSSKGGIEPLYLLYIKSELPQVRKSKTILDCGFHTMDSGF